MGDDEGPLSFPKSKNKHKPVKYSCAEAFGHLRLRKFFGTAERKYLYVSKNELKLKDEFF